MTRWMRALRALRRLRGSARLGALAWLVAGGSSLGGAAGCLDPYPASDDLGPSPAVEIVGLVKDTSVEAHEGVTLLLSGAVRLVAEDWPISVETEGGLVIDSTGQLGHDNSRIEIHPVDAWPLGATLSVHVESGFEDAGGHVLRAPEGEHLRFATRDPEAERTVCEVVSPTPGRSAPVNLRLVVVRCSGLDPDGSRSWASLPETVSLASMSDPIDRGPLVHERSDESGLSVYRVGVEGRRCEGLCPSTTYQIQVAAPGWEVASGSRGQIVTSSVTDASWPTFVQSRLRAHDDRPSIDIEASEDVVYLGYLTIPGPSGAAQEIPLASALTPARHGRLVSTIALPSRQAYEMVVWVEDLAGHRADTMQIPGVTGGRLAVSISEVVVAPLRDWGDSAGGGVPFDSQPGTGTVTSSDEWVELINQGDEVVDLVDRDVVLSVSDGTPSLTHLADAPALYFGSGGHVHAWFPGEALVVRPQGDAAKQDVRIDVLGGDRVLDTVALGHGGDHPGGGPPDAVHESIARDAFGRFRWCVPSPGDAGPARVCKPL
ncbi:MAG: hypothetical protein IPK13_18050 [Deltaproteobacteria bacterium]|nr:hypothetical protein [Deltaproteobacteria bacterium]